MLGKAFKTSAWVTNPLDLPFSTKAKTPLSEIGLFLSVDDFDLTFLPDFFTDFFFAGFFFIFAGFLADFFVGFLTFFIFFFMLFIFFVSPLTYLKFY